ncbi:hypothetical protein HOLleu_41981 [Holothuria leucospilota]|uniref:Uncharacterized protein n=1 Tax=Holothuria leucospilota TaxID=206669 RepID=A0A9Q1BB28_HOLLE|nr:hypothetical protein HOLleu_41981 [Holothuria leucospilota]
MEENSKPTIYEWQVLPFGTTCSPCCASFALKKHVADNKKGNEEVLKNLEEGFYVDNCLYSVRAVVEGKKLILKLRSELAEGGFNIRQWASDRGFTLRSQIRELRVLNYVRS